MPDRLVRRVLAPVELLELEEPDMSYAIRLCKQLDADLVLFVVIDTPTMVVLIGTHREMLAKKGSTLMADLVEDAKRILQKIVDTAARSGVRARGHATVHEDVPEQILKEAIVQEVDLILIRPGRRENFLQKLLGSTVAEVLHAAPCAVMVMQPQSDR